MLLSRACRLALVAAVVCLAPALRAQERPVAFVGATVLPVSGPPIANGTVVVQDGRILAIGPSSSVSVPRGADRVDVRGRTLIPGLVDTHSHIGGGDGGDRSAALHPDVRLLDSFNPLSSTIHRALAGGITTVNAMPGSGLLSSGQTLYLKLRRADSPRVEDLLYCRDAATEVCGGLKMANGTNPIGDAPAPGTRARSAAAVRALFTEALAYRAGRDRAARTDSSATPGPPAPDGEPGFPFTNPATPSLRDTTSGGGAVEGSEEEDEAERNLRLDILLEVLDGRRIVHFHTHRADDVMTVLRLAREFGFRPVLHHVSEAWRVADEIAAAGVPASIIVLDAPGGKLEAAEIRLENGGVLERAGVPTAIHTDDYITDSRLLLRSAALAARAGMSREGALRAVTLAGAEMLGLADRVGSLEPGKDADLVVLSGDPLSSYTRVEQTWVEGRLVFDRSRPADRAFAVGGYDAYDPSDNHLHGAAPHADAE